MLKQKRSLVSMQGKAGCKGEPRSKLGCYLLYGPNPDTLFMGKPGTEAGKSGRGQVKDRAVPRPPTLMKARVPDAKLQSNRVFTLRVAPRNSGQLKGNALDRAWVSS